MSQEQDNCLRFSLEEFVNFSRGEEVHELSSVSLEPNVTCHEFDQYVILRGTLELIGEYVTKQVEAEEQDFYSVHNLASVTRGEQGVNQFSYAFPVDVTVPADRVRSIDELCVGVKTLNCQVTDNGAIHVCADLYINGVYEREYLKQEKQAQDLVSDEDTPVEQLEAFLARNADAHDDGQARDLVQEDSQVPPADANVEQVESNQYGELPIEEQKVQEGDQEASLADVNVERVESDQYGELPLDEHKLMQEEDQVSLADVRAIPEEREENFTNLESPIPKADNVDQDFRTAMHWPEDQQYFTQQDGWSNLNTPPSEYVPNQSNFAGVAPNYQSPPSESTTQGRMEQYHGQSFSSEWMPPKQEQDHDLINTLISNLTEPGTAEYETSDASRPENAFSATEVDDHTYEATNNQDITFPFSFEDKNPIEQDDEFYVEVKRQPEMNEQADELVNELVDELVVETELNAQEDAPRDVEEHREERTSAISDIFSARNENNACVKVYIVQRGDSLDSLGEKYDMHPHKIARHNRLQLNENINEGALVYIPQQ